MKEAGILWAKLSGAKVILSLLGERKGRRFGLESRSWAIYQQASSSDWYHCGHTWGALKDKMWSWKAMRSWRSLYSGSNTVSRMKCRDQDD